jgi:hypothetical protein
MELLELIVGLIFEGLGAWVELAQDLRNRNDRGNLKRPSCKYVV